MGGLCTLSHSTEPGKSLPVAHELDPRGRAKLKELLTSPSWPAKDRGASLHLVKVAVETAPGWPKPHSCEFPLAALKRTLPESGSFQSLSDRQSGLKATAGEQD